MPALQGVGNCQYTALTTAGTTTLNPGPAVATPGIFGVLYGAETVAAGTSFAATFLDIVATSTNTTTTTLMSGTNTAGAVQSPGPAGAAVRYKGALVAVTSGTPGQINALWD